MKIASLSNIYILRFISRQLWTGVGIMVKQLHCLIFSESNEFIRFWENQTVRLFHLGYCQPK